MAKQRKYYDPQVIDPFCGAFWYHKGLKPPSKADIHAAMRGNPILIHLSGTREGPSCVYTLQLVKKRWKVRSFTPSHEG
jgi:hypothetical protein